MKNKLSLIFALASIMQFSSVNANFDGCCDNVCESDCQTGGGFFAGVDYMHVKSNLSELEYAILLTTEVEGTLPPKSVSSDFSYREPKSSWESGVRAHVGYRTCDCNWTFTLSGMYVPGKASGSGSVPPIPGGTENLSYYVSMLDAPFVGSGVTGARAEWKLDYGVIDLTVARNFYQSQYAFFSPYFGLRYARLDNCYRVKFEDPFYLAPVPVVNIQDARVRFKREFEGLGPRFGLNFEVPLICNFSLFGDGSASLVYGRQKTTDRLHGNNLEPSPECFQEGGECIYIVGPITAGSSTTKRQLAVNLESELGVRYTNSWRSHVFSLSCSYFCSFWFDQNPITNVAFTPGAVSSAPLFSNYVLAHKRKGDLHLQGFVFKAEISF